MSSLDTLRRQAAALGLVLIDARDGETIAHHVRETYNRVMTENSEEFAKLATQLRGGATMPLWAEGEQGARAADRMAEQFASYVPTMDRIAATCERIVAQHSSGDVVLTYDEEGYTVEDYEHNESRQFATEDAARPYFAERCTAVDAMEPVTV